MSEQAKTVENKPKKVKKQKDITIKANKKGRHIMPLFNFLRCLVIPMEEDEHAAVNGVNTVV